MQSKKRPSKANSNKPARNGRRGAAARTPPSLIERPLEEVYARLSQDTNARDRRDIRHLRKSIEDAMVEKFDLTSTPYHLASAAALYAVNNLHEYVADERVPVCNPAEGNALTHEFPLGALWGYWSQSKKKSDIATVNAIATEIWSIVERAGGNFILGSLACLQLLRVICDDLLARYARQQAEVGNA